MEEILPKNFNNGQGLGPGTYTSRTQYTGINNYNGYSEASGAIHDACGNLVSDPASPGLSRKVTVSYGTQVLGNNFACIVVEVDYYGTSVIQLTRLVYQLP